MKILVTGANGFIGRHLCLALLQSGHDVRAVVRSPSQVTTRLASAGVDTIFSDLGDGPIDSQLFDDIYCVIHCAGMAHIPLSDDDGAMVRQCKIINEDVPLNVFQACEANGVARFVFLSSSKVHGEFTAPGQSLTSASPYEPVDAYAISKYNAEKELEKVADGSRTQTFIVRPPLVYGQSRSGNIKRLEKLIRLGVPLPLGGIKNKRSMIGVRNLCDYLTTLVAFDLDRNFVVGMPAEKPISTPDLMRQLATLRNARLRMFSVPPVMLRMLLKLCGLEQEFFKISCDFVIESEGADILPGWSPKFAFNENFVEV